MVYKINYGDTTLNLTNIEKLYVREKKGEW